MRITEKRGDGYHNLVSLFLRLPAMESLTISTYKDNNVREIATTGHIVIDGKNIVEKTIECLESKGWSLPGLHVALAKQIPPGTGLGAGSGNAASFLRWAYRRKHSVFEDRFRCSLYRSSFPLLWAEKISLQRAVAAHADSCRHPWWGVLRPRLRCDAFTEDKGSFCNEWIHQVEVENLPKSSEEKM